MMGRRLLRRWPLLLALLLALLCALCVWRVHALSSLLPGQQAAVRWKGESERSFSQISCFLPVTAGLDRDRIYSFRSEMAKKLRAASLNPEEPGLYTDAWSAFDTVRVSAGRRSGEVSCIAVGGHFFDFHPLRLVSGSYLGPEDLMDDRVLLDRETAWLLFGAEELTGMSFSVNGTPFVVAGVYAHENDRFSRQALGDTMTVYMSYSAYERLMSDGGAQRSDVRCYEFVSVEPVKGFAGMAAQEKFPVKTAELVENSYRFEPERLYRLLRNRTERTMRRDSIVYPYWENAARGAEDRAAHWLLGALLSGAFPLALLLWTAIHAVAHGKRRLERDVLPETKKRTREYLRARSRRRWERRHPDEAAWDEAEPDLSDEEIHLL